MLVEAGLAAFVPTLLPAPEERPVLEGESAWCSVAVVVEKVVVQQRHRLDVGAVHDVVLAHRVPVLHVAFGQVHVEDAAASAHACPVHPHLGQQHLLDQALENWLEEPGRSGQAMAREREGVRHVGHLEAIAAEVVLARAASLHVRPVVDRLVRQIGKVPQVAHLQVIEALGFRQRHRGCAPGDA